MNRFLNNWIYILLALSICSIGLALIAEYFFDLVPCKLCLQQRYPYYVIIFLIIFSFIFKKTNNILLYIFNQISILYGLFYAIWHVGVEQKILLGPKSCSGTLLNTTSIQDLKEQITNQAIVNCSEISWVIMGVSAATINSLLLLFLLFFNTIFIKREIYG